MKKEKVGNPFVEPDENGEFWEAPEEGENLPRRGARCLFEINGGVLIGRNPVRDGFRAFGYRADDHTIMLPFWNARLGITVIKRWQYAKGPDFWNGTLKPMI